MGGSRNGEYITYINLIIVFFFTGLWHGASFNFIAWGLFYVVFLIFERLGGSKIIENMPIVMQHLYALTIIMTAWIFFRANTLTDAISYIYYMVVPAGNDWINFIMIMDSQYWFCIIIGIVFSIPYNGLLCNVKRYYYGEVIYNIGVISTFILAISYMIGSGYSPFLYFRF